MKRTPLKRSTVPLKRTPLKRISKRRQAEVPVRQAVRAEVLARDVTCRAFAAGAPGLCWHPVGEPLDVHEIVRRSRWAAGYLEPSNCLAVCRGHHDWIGLNDGPNGEARRLGLSAPERES